MRKTKICKRRNRKTKKQSVLETARESDRNRERESQKRAEDK